MKRKTILIGTVIVGALTIGYFYTKKSIQNHYAKQAMKDFEKRVASIPEEERKEFIETTLSEFDCISEEEKAQIREKFGI